MRASFPDAPGFRRARRLRRREPARGARAGARAGPGPAATRRRSTTAPKKKPERQRKAARPAERVNALKAEVGTMINFEFDRADIRQADQGTLDRKAAILAANSAVRVRISGHADDRGSDEYNLALGNRRAAAAKRYLENKGIEASRMEVVSFGEERPLNPGTDETAYAQNRRDEFEMTAGGDNLVAPQ